eukprot:MONOS_2913.1-p1 / transcript=MONOS_2913.1 / gene=MONOS_2913 / organism=Monocercomonoides_exilis_PA203 / gene_product=betaamylase / transcript_product=betaamylase / location=Mono_scaffold00063:138068-139324(+) / protein_length=418 / sequence_SO=supercontig / SO=protein_coding / is_pseudo=false
MPINTVSYNGQLNESACRSFGILKSAGVHGVKINVCWGICEKNPKQYNFEAYKHLADLCGQAGLKLQCFMSFHKCGESVGDDLIVPIPIWARRGNELFFRDKHGHDGDEYISIAVDNEPVLDGRTPIQVYVDFMKAFRQAMGHRIGTIIDEIQIGLGPRGELRYPGYQLDRWSYPGIGEFQAFSPRMIAMFQNASIKAGHPEWVSPPVNAGSYNSNPDDNDNLFFKSEFGEYCTEYGRFFANWYSNLLLEHSLRILKPAVSMFKSPSCDVAMKITGIYWWYAHSSHAAEMTSGYVNGNGLNGTNFYDRITSLCKELGVVLNFNCFEMSNDEVGRAFGADPESLVKQIISSAYQNDARLSSENTQVRYDDKAVNRIIHNSCNNGGKVESFSFQKLNDQLVYNNDNLRRFKRLINSLKDC